MFPQTIWEALKKKVPQKVTVNALKKYDYEMSSSKSPISRISIKIMLQCLMLHP